MLSSCLFINSLEIFVWFPIKHFLSQFHYSSLRLGHCFSFVLSVSWPNTALQPEKACRNVAAYWGGKQTVQGYCKCFQNKQCTLSRVRTKVHLRRNTNTRCLRQHKREIPYKALWTEGQGTIGDGQCAMCLLTSVTVGWPLRHCLCLLEQTCLIKIPKPIRKGCFSHGWLLNWSLCLWRIHTKHTGEFLPWLAKVLSCQTALFWISNCQCLTQCFDIMWYTRSCYVYMSC